MTVDMHQVKTSLTRSTGKIVRGMEKRQLLQQQGNSRSLLNAVLLCACVLTGCLLILGSAVGDDLATASERAMLENYESLSLPEELRDEGMEGRLKSFKGIRRHLPWSKGLVSVGRKLCHNFWADYIVAEVGTPPVDWVDPYAVPAGSTTDALYPETDETAAPPASDVAFAVPITSCPNVADVSTENDVDLGHAFRDAAAILKYGICKQSRDHDGSGGTCDYTAYAFVHPAAVICTDSVTGQQYDVVKILQDLDYYVSIQGEPVDINEVSNNYVRNNIESPGGGGIRSYLSLYAWTLTDHPVVVLLNFDVVFMGMGRLNSVVETMATGIPSSDLERPRSYNWIRPATQDSIALYTYEWYGRTQTSEMRRWGINTDFLVLKPGLDHFNSMKWIIRKADYDPTTGWQNYYHNFPGSMGSAGAMTWYLLSRPNTEIDHCVYTFENISPYFIDATTGADKCRVPDDRLPNNECFDCRGVPAEEVSIATLRECGAPWACTKNADQKCNDIFREWFSMRTEFEDIVSPYPLSSRTGAYEPETFLGFCTEEGPSGYSPMIYTQT